MSIAGVRLMAYRGGPSFPWSNYGTWPLPGMATGLRSNRGGRRRMKWCRYSPGLGWTVSFGTRRPTSGQWRTAGKGKRGGLRIIYYWDRSEDVFYMLIVYKKSTKEDLTRNQLTSLRKLVEEWLK